MPPSVAGDVRFSVLPARLGLSFQDRTYDSAQARARTSNAGPEAIMIIQRPFILLGGLVLVGWHDRAMPAQAIAFGESAENGDAAADHRRVVLFSAERVPRDFRGRVERLGGKVSES